MRLRDHLRASDTVARRGGDEFVCLIENVSDAAAVRGLESSVGLGVAVHPDHAHEPDERLRYCDSAMDAVEQAGGGAVTWGSDPGRGSDE